MRLDELAFGADLFQDALDGGKKIFQIFRRLENEITDAGAEGLQQQFVLAQPRDENGRHIHAAGLQAAIKLQAADAAGQFLIENEQIEVTLSRALSGFLGADRRVDGIAGALQSPLLQAGQSEVVLDDQQFGSRGLVHLSSRGRGTVVGHPDNLQEQAQTLDGLDKVRVFDRLDDVDAAPQLVAALHLARVVRGR